MCSSQELVQLHEDDDPALAATGVQPLLQVQEKPRRAVSWLIITIGIAITTTIIMMMIIIIIIIFFFHNFINQFLK